MDAASIFHRGDLQSGIARAITEAKLVICFVRDRDDQGNGRTWEQEWLAGSFGTLLTTKAVLLRIESGSQEASFLNAFCPITNTPMLAVIQNGQVLEKVEGEVTHEEFQAKLLKACGLEGTELSRPAPDSIPTPSDQAGQETAPPERPPRVPNVQAVLEERAQRLEAERQKREAAEKAERAARATARRKEAEGAEQASPSAGDKDKQQARDAWLYQQKQRKDEAKKERERILGQIEHDKQERRAARERQKESQQSGGAGEFTSISTAKSRAAPSTASSCALQVRLFDGTSIRSRFGPDVTLADGVRAWIKQASPEGGADVPYSFRQMLAPQPSRNIEVSEEHQSLRDLDLFPNATLMLVPVAGYTSAYEAANASYVGSALNAAYWCASTASSALGTAISYIPGINRVYAGDSQDAQGPSADQSARSSENANVAIPDNGKVRTLYDRNAEQDRKSQGATFYNGNSSAFEGGPRKGDAEDNDQ